MKTTLLLCAGLLTGCVLDDYAPDVGGPLAGACENLDSDPEIEVSFALDIRPVLDRPRGEAGCGCHTPSNGTPSGIALSGLDLGSYHALRQGGVYTGAQIVVPGDACSSELMSKLGATPAYGARMPLDGPPFLSAEEEQLIHDWIVEGAEDN